MRKWYQSRTVWVNALTLAAGVVSYIAGHELIADHAAAVSILVAVQGSVNLVLRFLTDKPLSS